MVFISLGTRLIVNVEALNMVESIGNVTRHRKATIVYKKGDSYVIRVVPAISGETLAHSYQYWIAELSKKENLPLCEFCEKGEFLKHCDLNLFGNKSWEVELKNRIQESKGGRGKKSKEEGYDPHEVEKIIVKNCVVEDIGGFLFPGTTPVKRTSRFQVGYMIPALDAIEKCNVEPQFHVRHSPSQAKGEQAQAQMIYYVEVSSAPYVMTFNMDIDGIGRTSMIKVEDAVDTDERKKRIKVALEALGMMLDTKIFGAKLTRFNPVIEYEVVFALLSKKLPFTISPPGIRSFISDTVNRAKKYVDMTGDDVKMYIYSGFDEYLKQIEDAEKVEEATNVLDLINKIIKDIEEVEL